MQNEETQNEELKFFTEIGFADIKNPSITKEQFNLIVEPTPKNEIELKKDTETAFRYKTVKGSYIKKRLNLIFGWNWDFNIINKEHYPLSSEVVVHGRLTIRSGSFTIIKEQFGKHLVSSKTTSLGNRTTSAAFNIGNGFKSAATDALKKCASEIGICWDIYSQEFPEGEPVETNTEDYGERKVSERFEMFLKKQTSIIEIDNLVEAFEDTTKLSDYQKKLVEKYKNKFNA